MGDIGTGTIRTVLETLYFSGAQAASRFWLSGLGGILMLHHVRDETPRAFAPNAGLSIAPAFLDRLLASLKGGGFEFVSMDELAERLRGFDSRQWRDPMIAVTLDDGYRDNLLEAAPIFRRHQVPYTIYVAPGLVDGRADLWWEDLEAVLASRAEIHLQSPKGHIGFDLSTPAMKAKAFSELMEFLSFSVSEVEQRRMVQELARQAKIDPEKHRRNQVMNWDEISELAKDPLCTIGAHTIHHYAVARLSEEDALHELRESAGIIEMETGERPRHFAFPYGSERVAGSRDFSLAARAGFDTAVTTRHGVLYPEHAQHLHALPRISVNGLFQAPRHVHTLLSGLPTRIYNRGRRVNVD